MAPFSVCSKCNVKTRKVVKDRITLKMIYLCPLCFKNRNTQQKKPLPKDENNTKVVPIKTIEDNYKKTEPEILDVRQTKLEPLKALEVQPSKGNQSRPHVFKPPLPLPLPRVGKLITPPVMQTVIINGRKYVAISETADD